MLKRTLLTLTLAVLAAAVIVPVALASRPASKREAKSITKAVQTTPVAGVNRIPTSHYTVGGIKITTLPSRQLGAWAIAQLQPTSKFKNTLQSGTGILVRPPRTNNWTVVDFGTSEVGCGIAPNTVLKDLYGQSGDVCPPGSGV
jgi:hypothetical protein